MAWALLDGEVVLYDPATGAVQVFNATASLLWQCLDGESTMDAIVDDLAAAFSVDRAVVEADCLDMVEAWAASGLVVHPGTELPDAEVAAPTGPWRYLADPPAP